MVLLVLLGVGCALLPRVSVGVDLDLFVSNLLLIHSLNISLSFFGQILFDSEFSWLVLDKSAQTGLEQESEVRIQIILHNEKYSGVHN